MGAFTSHAPPTLLAIAREIPAFGYEEVLKATNLITQYQPDVLMTCRWMVFNVLANNRDDHAKQRAYLMDSPRRLAGASRQRMT